MNDMERIIHLDMKGAPPSIQYLEKLFPLMRAWGGTGVLLEWEDTFPYSDELRDVPAEHHYTEQQVAHILKLADDNRLAVIPLVQTAGHMEFVLRGATRRHLREEACSPNCMCLSHPGALPLVRTLLAQLLRLHPRATRVHIGADEVWSIGVCARCRSAGGDASALYLRHVAAVSRFLRAQFPHLEPPLVWDDMLRPLPLGALLAHDVGRLVQPVVWNYSAEPDFRLPGDLWHKYERLGARAWAACAYRGASGSCAATPAVERHVGNAAAWRRELAGPAAAAGVRVRGLVLTGWARYDHYATLCELLPVSVPSLACCLLAAAAATDVGAADVGAAAAELLGWTSWSPGGPGSFPGWELATAVHEFVPLRDAARRLLHGDEVQTWLNPWQLRHNFTNPLQIRGILAAANRLVSELGEVECRLREEMRRTLRAGSAEWLGTNVEPLAAQLRQLASTVQHQLALAQHASQHAPHDADTHPHTDTDK